MSKKNNDVQPDASQFLGKGVFAMLPGFLLAEIFRIADTGIIMSIVIFLGISFLVGTFVVNKEKVIRDGV